MIQKAQRVLGDDFKDECLFSEVCCSLLTRVEIGNDVSTKYLGGKSKNRVILVEEWSEGVGLAQQNPLHISDTSSVVLVKTMELLWTFFFSLNL